MIDHVLGKPSPAFKRVQVFLVIMFWSWRLYVGDLKRRSKTRARLVGELFGSGWVGRRGGFLGIMGLINRKLSECSEDVSNSMERQSVVLISDYVDAERFSPYQLVVGTLTLMYAIRNLDVLVGLGCKSFHFLSLSATGEAEPGTCALS